MNTTKTTCFSLLLSAFIIAGNICDGQIAITSSSTSFSRDSVRPQKKGVQINLHNPDTLAKADTAKPAGSCIERAVFINQKNETKGVADEYKWLDQQYPGYKKMGQETIFKDGHPYDVVHIKTTDGKKKDVYYDIIKYYGKY